RRHCRSRWRRRGPAGTAGKHRGTGRSPRTRYRRCEAARAARRGRAAGARQAADLGTGLREDGRRAGAPQHVTDETLSTWLHLREPADAAARSKSLTHLIAAVLPRDEPVGVLDLATGTGSNLRYLAPRLPHRQRWLVVDRDAALLALMPAVTASWGMARHYDVRTSANGCVIRGERLECDVEARQLDLGTSTDIELFTGRHLVTASALLDLVSERWLRALAGQCRAVGAAALFAITYNGSSSCSPAEPDDEMIRDLLN